MILLITFRAQISVVTDKHTKNILNYTLFSSLYSVTVKKFNSLRKEHCVNQTLFCTGLYRLITKRKTKNANVHRKRSDQNVWETF